MAMQLPLINKVNKPTPWVLGLVAAGLLGTAFTVYLAVRSVASTDVTEVTVPVESKNLTVRIATSGTVKPIQSVNLSPKTAGRLAQLYVEQGDEVKQGQVVARMDNADIQAQLVQARARLAQASAKLAEAQAGSRPEEIAQA